MSDIRVKEPNTVGKVVLHTSHGDLDIELWSKECPKACRNFVQLCMEGYYNNLIFHRVIPNFMIQGGCKAGTGETCESIYGAPYPIERHGRLQFRHRGIVGVANAGKGTDTNGSQFFITLARADFLNNSHTAFGKISGYTAYNLIRLGEVEVDKADRPVDPPVIHSADVVWNPFDDIAPRSIAPVECKKNGKRERAPIAPIQNKNALSFDDESDEEGPRKTIKSAHDALGGKLLAQTAYDAGAIELDTARSTRSGRDSSREKPRDREINPVCADGAARCETLGERKKASVLELQLRNQKYEKLRGTQKAVAADDGMRKARTKSTTAVLRGLTKRLREAVKRPGQVEDEDKKEETPADTFAETYRAYEVDDDEDLTDWYAEGVRFHISSDRAYELDKVRAKQNH